MMKPHTGSGPSDNHLFERIQAGDQSALSELYDTHSRLLYSIIAAIVRDTDEAEDLLQEVFVGIWNSAGNCRAELGTPKTWMVRLAHNLAIDRLRSRRQQNESRNAAISPGTTEIHSATEAADTPTAATAAEGPGYSIAALSALPLEERSVIDLAFLQGYTHNEIATITGISPGSVRSIIRSGMMTLRSNLTSPSRDAGVRQTR